MKQEIHRLTRPSPLTPSFAAFSLAMVLSFAAGGCMGTPDDEPSRQSPPAPAPAPTATSGVAAKPTPAPNPATPAPVPKPAAPSEATSRSANASPVYRTDIPLGVSTAPAAPSLVPAPGLKPHPIAPKADDIAVRPGLELRFAHRAYAPAAGSALHKIARLPEDPDSSASSAGEYETIADIAGFLFFANTKVELGEEDVASVEIATDGLNSGILYSFTDAGKQKFRDASEKLAAANNAKNNGDGRLLFVLDGRAMLVLGLGQDPQDKKWHGFSADPANQPASISINAPTFAAADDQAAAFNRRKSERLSRK